MKRVLSGVIAVSMSLLVPTMPTYAVTVPAGTVIYGELVQEVTSKKKDFSEGDIVQTRVWRDVVVDGQVVLEAGSPMLSEISELKKANFAGIVTYCAYVPCRLAPRKTDLRQRLSKPNWQ